MGAEKAAGSPAEHLSNRLEAYIMRDVKENLKDHITVVPFEDRFRILKSLIDRDEQTALHHAAIRGHTDIIDGIFDSATEEQKSELSLLSNKYGNTAIALAAFYGHVDTVRFILIILHPSRRYDLLKTANNGGKSSLHMAAYVGQTDVINFIRKYVTEEQMRQLLMLQDSDGDTAIISAAVDGHANTAWCLLHAVKSDIWYEMLKVTNMKQQTALHIAASEGHTKFLLTITDSLSIEQIHHLLMQQENDGNTAIALASIRGHTTTVEFILNCIQDSDKKYEMLKVPNMQGQTTVHSAAWEGHTKVLMIIFNCVSEEQVYDLLMLQQDYESYTAIELLEQGGHLEKSKNMQAMIAQHRLGDFAQSDTLEKDTNVPSLSRTGIRQREEYAQGRGIECLNCTDLEEEVQQLRLHQNSLNTQQNERELLIEEQAAEIKELNIQNSVLTYQRVTLSRHVEELTMKVEELTKKVVDQHRKLTDAKEEIELLKNEICELEVKVEGNEEGNTSEAHNGGAMAADPNSDIEEVYSESSDEEYYPIDPGLISSLKKFCQDLSIQNCRVLQNPHIWQVITVLGTDANTKMSGKLGEFYAKNSKFKEQGYRVEVLDRQWKDHSSQLSLKFHGSTVTNSTCELIVQEQQLPGRLFAVGPAHMLFCPSANKEFQTENCDIHRIRNEIDQACPNRHQTQQVCPVRAMKVKADNDLELHVDQTPYIAYRYRYRAEDAPPTRDDPKRYTNDCVLLRCDQNKADHVRDGVRNACWLHSNTVDLSVSALQSAHDSRREIKVKNYKGRLCNVYDLSERIDKCEGIHLTFVITSKKRDETLCELKPGDSGSIVYYVGQETTEDGRKETYEPWGMLIKCTKLEEGMHQEMEERYTVYSAIVLHQAFRDIVDDYGTLGQIDLFRPRDPHPAN